MDFLWNNPFGQPIVEGAAARREREEAKQLMEEKRARRAEKEALEKDE